MKDNSEKIYNLWPLYIGEFINYEHNKIKDDLIKFFNTYEKKFPEGNAQLNEKDYVGNYNLYQSKYDLHNEDNKNLKELFKFIGKSILSMCKIANKKSIDSFNDNQKYTVNINESWFIRYNKEGVVFPHNHDGYSWSCVYYVQIGEDSSITNGSTYFLRPYGGSWKTDFGAEYLRKDTHVFKAEEGKLLVWPSYLLHGSHPYKGDKNRIIISANSTIDLLNEK